MTPGAIALARKRNVFCAPFRATQVGASLVNGLTFENQPLLAGETLDARLLTMICFYYWIKFCFRIEANVNEVYEEVKVIIIIWLYLLASLFRC